MNIITYEKNYKEVKAKWDKYKDWEQDKKGYFLIRVDRKKKKIELGFCKKKNVIHVKITGSIPQEIYHEVTKRRMITSYQHAAYIGKELHKAYIALKLGIDYVQDDELKL